MLVVEPEVELLEELVLVVEPEVELLELDVEEVFPFPDPEPAKAVLAPHQFRSSSTASMMPKKQTGIIPSIKVGLFGLRSFFVWFIWHLLFLL